MYLCDLLYLWSQKVRCLKVDCDEGGRQSKMTGNSKSHAVSRTAWARANGKLGDGMRRERVKLV